MKLMTQIQVPLVQQFCTACAVQRIWKAHFISYWRVTPTQGESLGGTKLVEQLYAILLILKVGRVPTREKGHG